MNSEFEMGMRNGGSVERRIWKKRCFPERSRIRKMKWFLQYMRANWPMTFVCNERKDECNWREEENVSFRRHLCGSCDFTNVCAGDRKRWDIESKRNCNQSMINSMLSSCHVKIWRHNVKIRMTFFYTSSLAAYSSSNIPPGSGSSPCFLFLAVYVWLLLH